MYNYYKNLSPHFRFGIVILIIQILEQGIRFILSQPESLENYYTYIFSYLYYTPIYASLDYNLNLFSKISEYYNSDRRLYFWFLLRFFIISIVITFLFYLFLIKFFSKILQITEVKFFQFISGKNVYIENYFYIYFIAFFQIISKSLGNSVKIFSESIPNEFIFLFFSFFNRFMRFILFYFFLNTSNVFITIFLISISLIIPAIFCFLFIFKILKNHYSYSEFLQIKNTICKELIEKNYYLHCFYHFLYRVTLFFHFAFITIFALFLNPLDKMKLTAMFIISEPFFMIAQSSAHQYMRQQTIEFTENRFNLFKNISTYFSMIFPLIFIYFIFNLFFMFFLQNTFKNFFNFYEYLFPSFLLIISKFFRGVKQYFASLFVVIKDQFYPFIFFLLVFIEFFSMIFIKITLYNIIFTSLFFSIFVYFFIFVFLSFRISSYILK